jgi:hypothetical protein
MKRLMLAIVVLVGAASAVSSVLVARQQVLPNDPGKPTLAQMFVVNGRDAAVPVVLQAGGEMQPVTIVGTPSVSLAGDATVTVRRTRQLWEYRTISVAGGDDLAAVLNGEGADGWEAVSVTAGSAGATRVLLKRPR